ncbi:hypothetical protein OH76DRAFT_1306033, partial [Lentinus brumalis]
DDDEGFVDEREQMGDEEWADLEESILPVKLVLMKIHTLTYKIINSSTILLPAWHEVVKKCGLEPRVLPRNIQTHWNSTFNMLEVALEYQLAIKAITASKKYDLREYKLDEEEWQIAEQLHTVMK